MSEVVVLDSGPLVAYLDRREQYHQWAVQQFGSIHRPALICEAAVTEACFLLSALPAAVTKIGEYLDRGILKIARVGGAAQPRIFELLAQYRDLPMSYADACLVWLAETHPRSRIVTLDSDFQIYRLRGGEPVPVLAPYGA
jgi:predicted nucleic acid-binding protein